MGNATSSEGGEDSDMQGAVQAEDSSAAGENLLDFSSLFHPDSLYKALLAIKEPPGSALSRSKEGMVRWLKSLTDRDELTVNMVQVVEHLTGKGVAREEALEFFSEVDRGGEGQVDTAYLLMVLKESGVDPMQALVPCHALPGPLEVYLPDKGGYSEAGRKLVQFLQARRVEPSCLVVGCMDQVLGHQQTREKLVLGRYQMLQLRADDEELLAEGEAGPSPDSAERVVIAKCFSKIDASTGQRHIKNLTDNRNDTYWQSNGSPRSHWIRVCMLPGVTVRELAVTVDSSDDSYMPRTITITVGNVESQLREIKTVLIPREKTGKVVLVRNLGRVYRYVQINFRACHSDGCDVKIRELHIKGVKVQEQKEPSVLDTMATWYISLLASTALAAIPVAPHLRDLIIAQSRSSLKALRPLVLSPSSSTRPEFLSPFVILEMEKMLKSLSLPEETFVSVSAESLEVLLAFSIAHGNVNSILDCLHILLDNQSVELNVLSLLQRMEEVKKTKRLNLVEALKLKMVSCSGGQKDDSHRPDNIVNNDIANNSATPYMSAAGHSAVSVVLREEDGRSLTPTRVVVQVPSADNAATSCLLFVVEGEPEQAWLEGLSRYKDWGQEDYRKWLGETNGEDGSGLIALLEFSKDNRQVEVVPDVVRSGRSLVLRMCASGEGVESVAVQAVNVFGHRRTEEEKQTMAFLERLDAVAPLPTEETGVVGGVVLCQVLAFLSALLQDLSQQMERRRLASLDPTLITEAHLSVEGLSLDKIWNLYIPLTLTPDGQTDYASLLALWLLRSALPFIKPDKRPAQETVGPAQKHDADGPKSDGDPLTVPSAVLSHLCVLLDAEEGEGEGQGAGSTVQRLAQEIVVEGVVVFFPDATARKEYLLSMIGSVLNEKQPRSWWLKFEALCQYFSKTDVNSLLGLPTRRKEGEEVETQAALELLSTMLTVATRESQMSLSSGEARPDDLVRLLCALQASLFFWCRKNMAEPTTQRLLLGYVERLVTKSTLILKEVTRMETNKAEKLKSLEKSLLARTLAEMLVFLTTIAESPMPRPKLMDTLYPLVPALHAANSSIEGVFLRLSEAGAQEEDKVSVVGVWVRESRHNYENNARVNEEFVCPSATKFVVEFDSRCVTERRYDYLEFTDVSGTKHKFDDTVGSERWPRTAEFSGQKLQFLFHSDGSNNEWGYKFTLKAFGRSPPSLHWLFDLQLSTAHLLGLLTSATLSTKTLYVQMPERLSEEQREEALLTRSDLWKTLFRGGYMVGKLTRSISGAHTASPADSALNRMLQDMANGPEGKGKQLLDSLREKGKGPYYGGELVDQAVTSVFAALIWHCQDLREELAPQVALSTSLHPSQLLQDAFSTAEALRRDLVESRQKLVEAKEKEEDEEKRSKVNEDAPLVACQEKAVFLLKFAGLSHVSQDEGEVGPDDTDGSPAAWLRRPSQHWQKVSNAISTVGRLKQQLSLGGQSKLRKRPLSFELVLSFVRNEAATVEKVHRLLQEREKLASSVAQAYTSASTYLAALSIDYMFELPGLIFLQQLLAKQRHFPIHYAAKLDGCGLELENQVRKSYRLLLQRLLDGLSAFSRPPSVEYSRARLLVGIVSCHLLDCQWQDYDHRLLAELHLSDFLLQSAIKFTQSEEKERVEQFEGEAAMLTRYSLHMALVKEVGSAHLQALEQLDLYRDNKWEAELFMVAKARSSQMVEVQCDGCESLVRSGTFYHNMELLSSSFDLCPSCFKNGSGTRPDDHTAEQLYHALGRFICDGCKLCIMTHRFHSNTQQDFDLCLGCLRKEEAKGSTDTWSVFLLTEVASEGSTNRYMTSDPEHSTPLLYQGGFLTRVGPALDLMVYQQQHCWLQLTALCLSMAHCLNSRQSSPHEQDYKAQECRNLMQCLRQFASLLRSAVLAKWEEQDRKAREEEKERQKKKEEEEEEARKEKEGGGDTTAAAEPANGEEGKGSEGGGEGEAPKATPTTAEDTPTTSGPPPPEAKATPPEDEDPITVASRLRCQGNTDASSMEKTFASLNMSRTLYTLAAVLPADLSLSAWMGGGGEVEQCLAGQLLPALLEVATCTPIQPSSRQLAYLVAAQYMARANPQVADRSIHIARGHSPDHPVQNEDRTSGPGLLTAQYFFSLGASFLRKSDFSGAATIAECLLLLSRSLPWKAAVSHSIRSPLNTRPEDMDMSSIFGLMVLAGFPKLHREGSLVRVHCSEAGQLQQPLSVLTSVEGDSGTVVSVKCREPSSVKLSRCEVEDTLRGCITFSQLPSLLPLLQRSLQLAKLEGSRQVEATWILALALKALLTLLEGSESEEAVKAVLKEGLMPGITMLASKGTRLSQKWLASDLEVVAIRGYQPAVPGQEAASTGDKDKEKTEGKEKAEGKEKTGDATDSGPGVRDGEAEAEDEGKEEEGEKKDASRKTEEACLEGLSDEIQDMLVIMQEAFQCPLPILRALFDASGSDVNQFIMSSEQYYDMDLATLKPPDNIVEAAKKWEPQEQSVQHEVQGIQDSLEDAGVTRLLPVPLSPSTLEAEPEKADLLKRQKSSDLMQEDSKTAAKGKEEVSREDSFQLLQEGLKGGVASREQLLKTQQAIVVLYARHVLASLLAHWPHPPHPRISTSSLGNMDIMQLFCLLDLLMKPLKHKACCDLLGSLVQCCEPTELVSLALTAVQCMRKVSIGMERRQFSHPADKPLEEKGEVVIANASSMTVVFHQTKGEVELSSKEDFSDHHKTISHSESNPQREHTHLIPGNTVHYRVTLQAAKEAKHPLCTISITGTQMGRFSTGLSILKQLFGEEGEGEAGEGRGGLASSLPLSQLWPNLIAVACQHTRHERLKVIHLLIRLLGVMKESAVQERPDLSALKPLWQLYTTLIKDYEAKNRSQQFLAPEIVRALTELFLAVEDQAEEWGVSQDMVIETLTREGLGTWLEKGISNVAFLSLGLGLDNTASRAFTEAKKSYVPPKEEVAGREEEDEEEDEADGDGSRSEEDSSPSSSESADSFDTDYS